MTQSTITKATIEVYKVRRKGTSEGWADISVDDQGKCGRLSIASDYGDWSYFWSDTGYSFKEFLTRLERCYFAIKLKETDYFYFNESCTQLLTDILTARRDEEISAETARTVYNDIMGIIKNSGRSKSSYVAAIQGCSSIWHFYESGESIPCVTGASPGFCAFFEGPWQVFINQLQEEVK